MNRLLGAADLGCHKSLWGSPGVEWDRLCARAAATLLPTARGPLGLQTPPSPHPCHPTLRICGPYCCWLHADPPAQASPRQNTHWKKKAACVCEASMPLAGVVSHDGCLRLETPQSVSTDDIEKRDKCQSPGWKAKLLKLLLVLILKFRLKELRFYVPINGVWGKGDNCIACFSDFSRSPCCSLSCFLDPRMAPKHCFSVCAGSSFRSGHLAKHMLVFECVMRSHGSSRVLRLSPEVKHLDDFPNRGQLELRTTRLPLRPSWNISRYKTDWARSSCVKVGGSLILH